MYTIGINAAFHDPAACLVQDGRVLAAAEEERFTRIKHGKRPIPFSAYELPFHAVDFCLQAAGLRLAEVDRIAYSYDPFIQLGPRGRDQTVALPMDAGRMAPPKPDGDSPWDPLFLSYIVNAPRHLTSGAPHHLQRRFEGAGPDGPARWHFVPHHLAHAASAFYASPFEEAAVLTLDGRGEQATTSYHLGRGHRLDLLGQVSMPHSLGLLYEEVTGHLGFLRSSDEYKVMALASFGKPRYAPDFREIVQGGEDGRYEIRPLRLTERFGPPRRRGEPLEQRHYDLAASLQTVLEETVLRLLRWLRRETGLSSLCLAGGVALNCVMNATLRDRGPFDRIWVQPAAGDAGTALGAALWIDAAHHRARPRTSVMEHAYLGPQYGDEEIEAFLRRAKVPYRRMEQVSEEAAALLAEEAILGWFQGAAEFGPRALGARSILASPIPASMQDRLNDIKDREDFRPVAPVVLEEAAAAWFAPEAAGDPAAGPARAAAPVVSPFMLFVYDVRPDKAHLIPAVRHVDGTARVQTVRRDQHPLLYDLLTAFERRTGVPVLVNTSFNTRGEPMVCSPRNALECFWSSPLDALVIGSFLIRKPCT